jgi:hypothetical protein
MITTRVGSLAIAIVAGLLTASFSVSQKNDQTEMLLQATNHELVKQQISRIKTPHTAIGRIFRDVCGRYSGTYRRRPSDAVMTPAILEGNGDQLELFGSAPLPLADGQPASAGSCPSRHCLQGATFLGCCGRLRVWGTDRLGACSLLKRCPD